MPQVLKLLATQELPHLGKPLRCHALSEDISLLKIHVSFGKGDAALVVNILALEEMILNSNVLGASTYMGHPQGWEWMSGLKENLEWAQIS
jgi:hypothetical protein